LIVVPQPDAVMRIASSPPASTPMSFTPLSPTNAWKLPIELLPPPTHATTASGNFPTSSKHCDFVSSPITL